MAKRRNLNADQPQIDASYEQDMSRLENVTGQVSDYSFTDEAPDMSRPKTSYLPATRPNRVRQMSQAESAAMQSLMQPTPVSGQVIQLPGKLPPSHTSHSRHTDDPITNAKAALLYSAAYGAVFGILIGALLILAAIELALGLSGWEYIGIELGVTAAVTIIAMAVNRQQGLHYSAPGLEHAQIKAETKQHNRSAEVEEYRIDADKEVRLAEISLRRELGQALVKKLARDDDEP